jgi:hypothetical protein
MWLGEWNVVVGTVLKMEGGTKELRAGPAQAVSVSLLTHHTGQFMVV